MYWNTEEQGGQCVLEGESAEALGACERVEIAGRDGTVCPESSWEPLMCWQAGQCWEGGTLTTFGWCAGKESL